MVKKEGYLWRGRDVELLDLAGLDALLLEMVWQKS